jgi:octaprenyl-diphosphate synthase
LNLSTNFDNPEISRAISRAAREVCSGEIIQTQRRFDLHLGIADYVRIVEMKTGSLFAAAAELAAFLNEAPEEHVVALRTFGFRIGAAYQIYDDCLDIAGNESTTGKTLGTDLRSGKLTLPILMLLSSSPRAQRERYCEWILADKPNAVSELLRAASTKEAICSAVEYGQDLVRDAEVELHQLNGNSYCAALHEFAEAIRGLFEQLRP